MTTNSKFDEYLKPEEAAPRLRRSVRTLARMRAEGRGPRYHKEGKLILYPASGLNEWLAHKCITPPRSEA